MPTPLEELSDWAVRTHTIPAGVHDAARRVLMDQVGVSLGGANALKSLVRGEPSATLWSTGECVHAPDAALANRFAGDDLELNAGPEVAAAGVAAGEVADATLGELYVAMAVASEIESYARGWFQRAVEEHGLHPPAVFALSAATVAAKLCQLDAQAFSGALAIALALAPQSHYASFSHGATASCPKTRTEPKARILEAFSKFAETSRRGTGPAIGDPEQTSPPGHPFRPACLPELLCGAVQDEEALAEQKAVDWVGEITAYLHHESAVRPGSDSSNVHFSRRELDDDEHVVGHEPAERGDLDGEEVGGRDAFPMGGQKRAPRRPLTSLGRGLDAVLS